MCTIQCKRCIISLMRKILSPSIEKWPRKNYWLLQTSQHKHSSKGPPSPVVLGPQADGWGKQGEGKHVWYFASQPPSSFRWAGFTDLLGGWTQAWECRLRCVMEVVLLWPGLGGSMIWNKYFVPPSLTTTYICYRCLAGWWWWCTWKYWHVIGRYVFMKNAYGTVLRATCEAHLGLWGAKHRYFRCTLTQLTSVIKQVAITWTPPLNTNRQTLPECFQCCTVCGNYTKTWHEMMQSVALNLSLCPLEASGTHKSWRLDLFCPFHRLLAWSKACSGHVLSLHGSQARGWEQDLCSAALADLCWCKIPLRRRMFPGQLFQDLGILCMS